ncbi:polysaccharide deacetylase family protein [Nonomuraea endophytica]|uniref:Peptidoglycan/xylan/chitin deacetylase (PgdA/CDA1 family) n=1 Tax=Nonomuraea endophytica TaxID=714136 RepID=A0A7W8EIY1_9ACTN|nr:polysaccharide deacetylase family protein [Nonomuraea endophytica]MBB5080127.1 peptidoglycan/xylan/chitin deacetylase (PgdA/CDA1 family) [Nonomuraea endophytica]
MLYSGVSWGADGYEVEVLDVDGRAALPPARFGAGQMESLIGHLTSLGDGLVTVVESTIGILDGRMMSAGLDVYRADPQIVPGRPAFGSVPAGRLARAAYRDLAALTRLDPGRGTQTGREGDLEAGIADGAAALAALAAAGRCLSHGPRERREVALTFDDGPQPPYTGQVLDVLERYGVRATFFCVGLNAGAHAEEIARMREQGHAVGNHTWSHPFLPELSRAQLAEQIERTGAAIAGAGGGRAPVLFRPPYGSRNAEVMGWLRELGTTVVLWDVEPFDWAMPGAREIAEIVLGQVRPGSIILLHDGGGDRSQTVGSLAPMIEGLLDRGYRFVLVDELQRVTR